MNILVTGGAGYIGSHIVKLLGEETTHNITIIDNLSSGKKENILYGELIEADLSDFNKVEEIFKSHKFDAIIHFAAYIVVSESTQNPLKYYLNNTANTTNLINLAIKYRVNKFIFSSTAAVYGEPEINLINEETLLNPINPYGMSKLMSERVLIDSAKAYSGFKYVILRYFNVAGADIKNRIGECHEPETHLIPLIAQTALGKRDEIKIFGDKFNTKDGTCIRDYIHIEDLASAHIKALEYLKDNESDIFNCGYGRGFSVKEVIETMKKVSKVDFKITIAPPRDGDPAILVADNSKIKTKMNFSPKFDDLEVICKSALEWEKKREFK